MAVFYPPLNEISNLKPTASKGELLLLNYLSTYLSDDYEVYFQPLMNGDFPDIIIMHKGHGVVIIEVKDWNLQSYSIEKNGSWKIKSNNVELLSPLQQVLKYKENLFNLHNEELFNRHIKSNAFWPTVNCCVFFSEFIENDIRYHLYKGDLNNCTEGYKKIINETILIGKDSLSANNLLNLISGMGLNKRSLQFDDDLYKSFKRYFQPPFHRMEEGREILYSKEQQALITSQAARKRKIKGVAGCGKTLVLAKLAVNAHKRTGGRVLILTYNISLKNYIHDRINDVREDFFWSNFHITNYHQFFKAEAYRYNLKLKNLGDWEDVSFFKEVENEIRRYDVVLIDEVQDYLQEWIDIIAKYFLSANTEFIVFGDEKQNIYEREVDENKEPVIRKISGGWNKSLNTSYRLSSDIGNLALRFQRKYFAQKYSIDDMKTLSTFDFEKRIIEYHYFSSFSPGILFDLIYRFLTKHGIHSSDVGILGSKIETLRDIDYLFKSKKNERTKVSFETKDEFDYFHGNKSIMDRIRRTRKFHFWMKTGTVKLCTTHSFKGWETNTLFLLLDNNEVGEEKNNAELIYTGITRARSNLVILNLGLSQYDEFFRNNVSTSINHVSNIDKRPNLSIDDLPF